MLIDSHCHLTYPGLKEQQEDVVARAVAAGVDTMVTIATVESEWPDIRAATEHFSNVFGSIGVHPHEADQHRGLRVEQLVEAGRHPKIVGFGETGLDYHYNHSSKEEQQRSFRIHIEACRETQLPLIVHTRDAEEDTVAILKDELKKGSFPIVIHCFSGSSWLADACLELGAVLSLSGIVTFKNAKDLQAIAQGLPADRMLVETDSPFLAPVPMRGKTGEPAFVAITARFLADLRHEAIEDLARNTRNNTLRVFEKMAKKCA